MKAQRYIYKRLTALFLTVSALLLQGCVADDLSECGVSIKFMYTNNVDEVDLFDQEVERINLYLFDSNGAFIAEYAETASRLHSNNNIMSLNVMEGTYDVVAWGNLCDDFELPEFTPGVTTINEVILSLKRTDNIITNKPARLFHGGLYKIKIEPTLQKDQTFVMDMMRDTKDISVTTKGLPVVESSTNQNGYTYSCNITSINGDYNFDNTIAGTDRLQYIPDDIVDEEKFLISDFVTMRELNDKSTGSRLIVVREEDEREIFNESLVDLLLPVSVRNDLDVEHEFDIELKFDESNGTVSVTVNGWNFSGDDYEYIYY